MTSQRHRAEPATLFINHRLRQTRLTCGQPRNVLVLNECGWGEGRGGSKETEIIGRNGIRMISFLPSREGVPEGTRFEDGASLCVRPCNRRNRKPPRKIVVVGTRSLGGGFTNGEGKGDAEQSPEGMEIFPFLTRKPSRGTRLHG
ncbi:hypothetical protein ZHAS_00010360 [Anopheles sinensis]|uniref:Uncharacterized protein n=1 Tax=Anopheles sinensis TaxID=74873 RepID=A0A084VXD7_ANOSI|nr:hypothetical protein ZHAS_00010360 [Anopheles sinensis]